MEGDALSVDLPIDLSIDQAGYGVCPEELDRHNT